MSSVPGSLLPVHGFVLAGGKSSRMGQDKALLRFRGRPMVEIAVSKLREFCSNVSIAGNRDDLSAFAPVVQETLLDAGPAAGFEAGLRACVEPWAMFMPVDVPLVPAAVLHRWAATALSKAPDGCGLSSLSVAGEEQPAFCLIKSSYLPFLEHAVKEGERKLRTLLSILEHASSGEYLWICAVDEFATDLVHLEYANLQLENWFRNVNTPMEFVDAEAGWGPE
ncbi:MAG: molybdenum cofactor guanylyltransferase [Janthinobacterium lividum]